MAQIPGRWSRCHRGICTSWNRRPRPYNIRKALVLFLILCSVSFVLRLPIDSKTFCWFVDARHFLSSFLARFFLDCFFFFNYYFRYFFLVYLLLLLLLLLSLLFYSGSVSDLFLFKRAARVLTVATNQFDINSTMYRGLNTWLPSYFRVPAKFNFTFQLLSQKYLRIDNLFSTWKWNDTFSIFLQWRYRFNRELVP